MKEIDREIAEIRANLERQLTKPARVAHSAAMVELQNAATLGDMLISAWATRDVPPGPMANPGSLTRTQAGPRDIIELVDIVRAREAADEPGRAPLPMETITDLFGRRQVSVGPDSRPRGFKPAK
jgi:hypothetical protein